MQLTLALYVIQLWLIPGVSLQHLFNTTQNKPQTVKMHTEHNKTGPELRTKNILFSPKYFSVEHEAHNKNDVKIIHVYISDLIIIISIIIYKR